MNTTYNTLLKTIVELFNTEYSLPCQIVDNEILLVGAGPDEKKFSVLIFSNLSIAQAGIIGINGRDLLVVTRILGKKVAEILRKKEVFYADTLGNAFIRTEKIILDVRGKTGPVDVLSRGSEKLRLETKGIKMLISFFSNPVLLNENYRVIARNAGCSLGYVSKFLTKLRATGFIIKSDTGQLRLTNKSELLQRLRFEYRATLKDKYLLGRFRTRGKNETISIKSSDYAAYFTSGKALETKSGNLKEKLTELYLEGDLKQFIKVNHLFPDKDGDLIVYQKYWVHTDNSGLHHLAPDFIVYLDLITSADPRLMEGAAEFYGD